MKLCNLFVSISPGLGLFLPSTPLLGDSQSFEIAVSQSSSLNSSLSCMARKVGFKFKAKQTYWADVRNQLLAGNVDGFFSYKDPRGMGATAVASATVVLEKWNSYAVSESKLFDRKGPVGVLSGSSQERWLKSQNFSEVYWSMWAQALIKNLMDGRLSVILVDEAKFQELLQNSNLKPSSFLYTTAKYSQFSIYLGKKFLVGN